MHFTWAQTSGPWRIAQTHRPRAGSGLAPDLAGLRASGVDVLVSCLTDEEEQRFDLGGEAAAADQVGIEFRRFPIVDHSLPESVEAAVEFADGLAEALEAGRAVVLHCFAGIGRSGLMLVTTLVRLGVPLDDAVRAASEARGLDVPETRGQVLWLTQVKPRE